MAMTFAVFVLYGLFAASVRDRIVTRPKVMTWLRRSFAAGLRRARRPAGAGGKVAGSSSHAGRRLASESKSGPKARRCTQNCFVRDRMPGRSEGPTRARKVTSWPSSSFDLLRLFSLLRFLSHSILIGFNGWKRDTRHARGGLASQQPQSSSEQIRRRLPRAVTPLSLRYPQLLCVFGGFSAAPSHSAASRHG